MQDFPIDMPDHEKHVQCSNRMVGRRRSRTPICWIRAASETVARSRTARDRGVSPYIWRLSLPKLKIPSSPVRPGCVVGPRADFRQPYAGSDPEVLEESVGDRSADGLTAMTNTPASPFDATSIPSRVHNEEGTAPIGKPSADPIAESSVCVAQARLRAPSLQHYQLLA